MKTWRVVAGSHVDGLKLMDEAPGKLAPTQVRVRLRAAALNFRDTMVLRDLSGAATDRKTRRSGP